MKVPHLRFLLLWLVLAGACAPAQQVEVTRQVVQTVEVTRQVEVTNVVSQIVAAPIFPNRTLTPLALTTLDRNAKTADLTEEVRIFPILVGTRWLYTEVDYSQGSDPGQILSAVISIEDRVSDVQNQPPYYVAHIQRTASLVRADADLDLIGVMTRPGNSEYWYILIDGRVYQSKDRPDLANLHLDQLSEELNIPMKKDLSWCPRKSGDIAPQAQETPIPCQFVGSRIVLAEQPFETQAGFFDDCYQLEDVYNNGSIFYRFCNGVGFVTSEFRHSGTVFGNSKWLVDFSQEKVP